ncbi:Hypothetical_protein [Hexamita inflata]|uniref:Hypothetical_protein n=1 Tax=Hexamita inflata TaxID=28002 RepID=A0AA86TF81_9EUKA|nr:Hypothetical protein HINF_LOCUS2207 [Hexamita inflata]
MSQDQLLQLKVNALLQKELQKIFNARKTGEDKTASIKELNPSEEAKEPKSVQIIQQLSERNKQYIVQYVKEHNALSTAQIIFYLAKHFVNKHGIAKSAVQQFVLDQVKIQLVKSENQDQKQQTQTQDKQSDQQINQQEIKQLSAREIYSQKFKAATKLYQTALQKMNNVDYSTQKPKEICLLINSLETKEFNIFWEQLQEIDSSNSLVMHKYFYYKTYSPVTQVKNYNNLDKEQIFKQVESQKITVINQNKQPQSNNISKKIEPQLVQNSQDLKISKRQKIFISMYINEHRQFSIPQIASFLIKSKLFKLSHITSSELVNYISKMNVSENKDQYQELNQDTQLSQEQELYIKKYIQEHTQITVPKMAMYLLKSKQFNLTNITSDQLQSYINDLNNQSNLKIKNSKEIINQVPQKNNKLEQSTVNSSQTTKDNENIRNKAQQATYDKYTQVYKTSLNRMSSSRQYSNYTPKQLCEEINSLSLDQTKIFWNYVSQQIPGVQSAIIKKYYIRNYCSSLYSDFLNNNDRKHILSYIQNNALTTNQQTQYLIQNYFKSRRIFPQKIINFITNWKYNQQLLTKSKMKNQQ